MNNIIFSNRLSEIKLILMLHMYPLCMNKGQRICNLYYLEDSAHVNLNIKT